MDIAAWIIAGLFILSVLSLIAGVLVGMFIATPDEEYDGRILPMRDDWGV